MSFEHEKFILGFMCVGVCHTILRKGSTEGVCENVSTFKVHN